MVRKGIPDSLRSTVWPLLMIIKYPALPYKVEYNFIKEAISVSSPDLESQILMDVRRTYPNHEHFTEEESKGFLGLTNVLKALSGELPDMGYCQGINFIAAVLMLYLSEEVIFPLN